MTKGLSVAAGGALALGLMMAAPALAAGRRVTGAGYGE